MVLSTMKTIICSLVLLSVFGDWTVEAQGNQWQPPAQAKLYQRGEATYLQTPGDGTFNYSTYIVEDRRQFVLQVRACSGVLLGLGSYGGGPEAFVVRIELGASDNTMIEMRRPPFIPSTPPLFSGYTKNLLHCNEFRAFWVKWNDGVIMVGRGPLVDEQPLMKWTDPQRTYVNAMHLSSTGGSSAVFIVHENSASHMEVHTFGDNRYTAMWKSVEQKNFWRFSVHPVEGHANILLTDKLGNTQSNVYEFVLGEGFARDRALIRTEVNGGLSSVRQEIRLAGLVDTKGWKEFWISWYRGQIELGHGGIYGKKRLLVWKDPNPFTVRYLSVGTGFNSFGHWFMQDDQESVNEIFTYPVSSSIPAQIYNTTWIRTPRSEFFTTAVKTCKEAYIVISNSYTPTLDTSLELVLGANNNTKSFIRYLGRTVNSVEADTVDILNCTEPRYFWISWNNRTLRVGKGHIYSSDILFSIPFGDSSADGWKVAGIGLATPTNNGEWRVQESIGEAVEVFTPSEFNDFNLFWRSVTQQQFLVFRVRTCSDCHVAMSPTLGVSPEESYYDLVISGYSNRFTLLHQVTGINRVVISEEVATPDLLNCNYHVDLWVAWNNNAITMGRGVLSGFSTLFTHTFTDGIFPVKAVSFSTGFGNDGSFTVDENIGDYFMFYTSLHDSVRWLQLDTQITWLSFRVRACQQVMMYMCAQQNNQNCYTITFGSNNNTKSSITARGTVMQEVDTPDILHCLTNRYFWVRWGSGKLDVGHGTVAGLNPFLSYQDPTPIQILNAGFQSTVEDNYARWQIDKSSVLAITFLTPVSFTYEQMWETVERKRGATFGVMACSDVHVIVSNKLRWWDDVYDIVIGGWHNTRSVIRETTGGRIYTDVDTPDILHCSQTRYFWITWQYGAIEVGYGEIIGKDRFMDFQPLNMYQVNAIGYSTGYDYNGTWYIKSPALLPTDTPPTAGPQETPPPMQEVKLGMSQDELAGIVLGVMAVLLIAGVLVIFMRTRNASIPGEGAVPNNQTAPSSGGGRFFSRSSGAAQGDKDPIVPGGGDLALQEAPSGKDNDGNENAELDDL